MFYESLLLGVEQAAFVLLITVSEHRICQGYLSSRPVDITKKQGYGINLNGLVYCGLNFVM